MPPNVAWVGLGIRRYSADGVVAWQSAPLSLGGFHALVVDADGAWVFGSWKPVATEEPRIGSQIVRVNNDGQVVGATRVWPSGHFREVEAAHLHGGKTWLIGSMLDWPYANQFSHMPIKGHNAWIAEVTPQLQVIRERAWNLGRDRSRILHAAPLPGGWLLAASRTDNMSAIGNDWLSGKSDRAVLTTDPFGNTDCPAVKACAGVEPMACATGCATTCSGPMGCQPVQAASPCAGGACATCAP